MRTILLRGALLALLLPAWPGSFTAPAQAADAHAVQAVNVYFTRSPHPLAPASMAFSAQTGVELEAANGLLDKIGIDGRPSSQGKI